ncbi:MAG: DNA methyltransferase [Candidatus Merdivicinus sp.]|jgi:adenine-specific DNA-methyltransferase
MAELHELIAKIENPELRAQIAEAAKRALKHKQFGLVFEEHLPECTPLFDIPARKGAKVSVRSGKANETYTVLKIVDEIATCLPKNSKETVEFAVNDLVTTAELGDPIYPCLQPLGEVCNAPDSDLWHTLIEADNYHALQLLEYLYGGKVDCIYIDPPYNTGARDWKYNNDYVDGSDEYRHSKWLSFMQKRLEIAKKLLNSNDSVLIVTIDEKEYLHLGCLLEEMFPDARMQMISSVINPKGTARTNEFSRVDEYIFFVMIGDYKLTRIGRDMLTQDVSEDTSVRWRGFPRTGRKGLRPVNPGSWYPIYFNISDDSFHSIGDTVQIGEQDPVAPEGTYAIWPPVRNGEEYSWAMVPETFRRLHKIGAIKFGHPIKGKGCAISYLTNNQLQQIQEGSIIVTGRDSNGTLEVAYTNDSKTTVPKTQWNLTTHEAGSYGTNIVGAIIPGRRFAFPKSIYSPCRKSS